MAKLMQWDVECKICGKQEEAFFREDAEPGAEDGIPMCCGQAMVKRIGAVKYHQDQIDYLRSKRAPGQNFRPDPLTKFCIEEGLRRRKKRLGGTGQL